MPASEGENVRYNFTPGEGDPKGVSLHDWTDASGPHLNACVSDTVLVHVH